MFLSVILSQFRHRKHEVRLGQCHLAAYIGTSPVSVRVTLQSVAGHIEVGNPDYGLWGCFHDGATVSKPATVSAYEGLGGPVFWGLWGLRLGSELPSFVMTLPLTLKNCHSDFCSSLAVGHSPSRAHGFQFLHPCRHL